MCLCMCWGLQMRRGRPRVTQLVGGKVRLREPHAGAVSATPGGRVSEGRGGRACALAGEVLSGFSFF